MDTLLEWLCAELKLGGNVGSHRRQQGRGRPPREPNAQTVNATSSVPRGLAVRDGAKLGLQMDRCVLPFVLPFLFRPVFRLQTGPCLVDACWLTGFAYAYNIYLCYFHVERSRNKHTTLGIWNHFNFSNIISSSQRQLPQ